MKNLLPLLAIGGVAVALMARRRPPQSNYQVNPSALVNGVASLFQVPGSTPNSGGGNYVLQANQPYYGNDPSAFGNGQPVLGPALGGGGVDVI